MGTSVQSTFFLNGFTSSQSNAAFLFKVSSFRNTLSLRVLNGVWKSNFNELNFHKLTWQKEIIMGLHMKWPENVTRRHNQNTTCGSLYTSASEKLYYSVKYLWIICSRPFQKVSLGQMKTIRRYIKRQIIDLSGQDNNIFLCMGYNRMQQVKILWHLWPLIKLSSEWC